jgi:hypothetical protein
MKSLRQTINLFLLNKILVQLFRFFLKKTVSDEERERERERYEPKYSGKKAILVKYNTNVTTSATIIYLCLRAADDERNDQDSHVDEKKKMSSVMGKDGPGSDFEGDHEQLGQD